MLGWWVAGLAPAAALLLASALAPTDPVLASDVQVGEPTDDEDSEDEVRFALTSEAGLNDGLAFPFTYLAIAMATAGGASVGSWLGRWVAVDVLYKIAVGLLAGLAIGWLLGKLFFRARSESLRLANHAEGFTVLAATFLAYGMTEVIGGYGFLAVFVCACSLRAAERDHGHHQVMHDFAEQVERLLHGRPAAAARRCDRERAAGPADLGRCAVAVLLLFVVRPLTGWLALRGAPGTHAEHGVIGFFGIRGIGSLYYLSYAMASADFPQPERLWAIVGLVILVSVVVHGITATPMMQRLDRARERTEPATRPAGARGAGGAGRAAGEQEARSAGDTDRMPRGPTGWPPATRTSPARRAVGLAVRGLVAGWADRRHRRRRRPAAAGRAGGGRLAAARRRVGSRSTVWVRSGEGSAGVGAVGDGGRLRRVVAGAAGGGGRGCCG